MTKYKNAAIDEFSLDSYRRIIELALKNKYKFMTVKDFISNGCPKEKVFIMRHDFDKKPENCDIFFIAEREFGVRSTTYVRVANNDYNPFSYQVYSKLKAAEEEGFEIGLHANFVEFATINKREIFETLIGEWSALAAFYNIVGMSCHRDVNYVHNSLPWVYENWEKMVKLGIKYHAYDNQLLDSVLYVNEGLNPHLCWRGTTPREAIETGKSICLLTHNHWWYQSHPFE